MRVPTPLAPHAHIAHNASAHKPCQGSLASCEVPDVHRHLVGRSNCCVERHEAWCGSQCASLSLCLAFFRASLTMDPGDRPPPTTLRATRRSPRSSRDGSRYSAGEDPGEPRSTSAAAAMPDKGSFWRGQLMLPPPEGHQLGSPRRAYQSNRGSPQRGVAGSPGVGFLVSSLVAGAGSRRRRIRIPTRHAQQLATTLPNVVKHRRLLRPPTGRVDSRVASPCVAVPQNAPRFSHPLSAMCCRIRSTYRGHEIEGTYPSAMCCVVMVPAEVGGQHSCRRIREVV
jgi:hypothetical protein